MKGNLLRGYHIKQVSLCTFTSFVTDTIVAEDVNGHPKRFRTEEVRETYNNYGTQHNGRHGEA
jgi:hypothetical protein